MIPSDADRSHSDLFSGSMPSSTPFEEICRRMRPILKSIVEARLDSRLLQRLDASDIVQETLLEAHRRLAEFERRKPMPIVSWLRESALQQLGIAIRHHRRAKKRSVLKQVSYSRSSVCRLVERMSAYGDDIGERHVLTEQATRTREALFSLSPLDREILLLRYVNELSNAEAAQLLKVSEAVASKRHGRALLRLQQRLTKE